ncbi:MAG: hypothetical protein LBP62_05875 [Clostridiales bacterium]|jgi:FtsH-binding integral membrane protein|nr:hypothetical protein [Clostridiales bacterium]
MSENKKTFLIFILIFAVSACITVGLIMYVPDTPPIVSELFGTVAFAFFIEAVIVLPIKIRRAKKGKKDRWYD